MEASSEGERLAFPFINKIYDISNAALFYAHNGRLDHAQEQLTGQSRKKAKREKAAGGTRHQSSADLLKLSGYSRLGSQIVTKSEVGLHTGSGIFPSNMMVSR